MHFGGSLQHHRVVVQKAPTLCARACVSRARVSLEVAVVLYVRDKQPCRYSPIVAWRPQGERLARRGIALLDYTK